MRGMGLEDAAIARPFIGVVTTAGDTTPCNGTLAAQAAHAQEGVLSAGGTPRAFTTISVSDGISMNHQGMKCSLVSREVIADSIELVLRGHAYDGLIGFGGCDKNLPGIMMAMVRCNAPSVFIFGGSLHGKPVSVLTTYEAAGAVMTGAMAAAELDALERRRCQPLAPAPDNSPPTPWAWSRRCSGLRRSARR
jgi:dihydroxy-acid dehydratase